MTLGNSNLVSINASTQSSTSNASVQLIAKVDIGTIQPLGGSTAASASISLSSAGRVDVTGTTSATTSNINSNVVATAQVIATTSNALSNVVIQVADPTAVVVSASTEDSSSNIVIEQFVETVLSTVLDSVAIAMSLDLWEEYVPEVLMVAKHNSVFEVDKPPKYQNVTRHSDVEVEHPRVNWRK